MKVGGVFFDVGFERDEVFVDEGRDIVVRVGLGLQPSARASSRGGTKINEQRFLCRFGFSERCVRVFVPLN
jgi:hypothetical protein